MLFGDWNFFIDGTRLIIPNLGSDLDNQDQSASCGSSLWDDIPCEGIAPSLLPLLKWPGGKRYLIKYLKELIPSNHGRYIEAFAGGAALFFALLPKSALLADTNVGLINCYVQIRDRPEDVVNELAMMPNTREDYYRIRKLSPVEPATQAARFIYLVTLSFNGIYRENRLGEFNVPYGYKTHLQPCDPKKLHAASLALAHADIQHRDFEDAVKRAKSGDVIYLDPPYTLAHGNNGFVKYNAKIFSWRDQERLANVARKLDKRGCRVIITNAAHSSIAALYEGFAIIPVERQSVIAAEGKHRKLVSEFIIHNGE